MQNTYVLKWVLQRITAFILIPLSFWFIYHCIAFQGFQYVDLKLFFQSYINSFLFLIMMTTMIIHSKLGCETIVQDYVSSLTLRKNINFLVKIISIIILFLVFFAIIKLHMLK